MKYRDAIWRSTRLNPTQRLVALCYADHVQADTAWVVVTRLMERTGITSRTTACRVVASLCAAGWLIRLGAPPEHRQRVRYRLQIPDETASPSSAAPGRSRAEDGTFAAARTGPPDGPVHRVDRSTGGAETGPLVEPKPVHPMDETGPPDGTDFLRLSRDSHRDSPRGPLAALGASAEEEKMIIDGIQKRNPNITHLGAYLAAMARNGDLAEELTKLRSTQTAATRSATITELHATAAASDPCPHAMPGGTLLHPATQRPLCPLCRLGAAAEAPASTPRAARGRTEAGGCQDHPYMPAGSRPDGLPACPLCRAGSRPGLGNARTAPRVPATRPMLTILQGGAA